MSAFNNMAVMYIEVVLTKKLDLKENYYTKALWQWGL